MVSWFQVRDQSCREQTLKQGYNVKQVELLTFVKVSEEKMQSHLCIKLLKINYASSIMHFSEVLITCSDLIGSRVLVCVVNEPILVHTRSIQNCGHSHSVLEVTK